MKKDERVSNPSKMRVDLRLYSELVSVSVFSLKLGLPLLGNVLTTLVAQAIIIIILSNGILVRIVLRTKSPWQTPLS